MLKRWFEIIFDHRISLKERMFRLVTIINMIALIIILPMGKSLINLLILAASLACITAIVKISVQKDCIHAGATAISVLLLILFPLSFFTAGGFYSGMPEWFILCFIYISITLEGRRKGVFFCFACLKHCFAITLHFIFPRSSHGIPSGIPFLILPHPSF